MKGNSLITNSQWLSLYALNMGRKGKKSKQMLTCLCVPSLYGCSLMRGRCTKNGLRLEGTTGRCGGASGTAPWHARKDTGHAFLRFACLPAPAPPCFFHCYQSDSVRVVTVLGDRQIRQHENDSSGSVSATKITASRADQNFRTGRSRL